MRGLRCPYIKKVETLTYRGDNSRSIYKNFEKFSEGKKVTEKVYSKNYKRILGIPIWELKKIDSFDKEKLINEILAVKKDNPAPQKEYNNHVNLGFHQQGYETPLDIDSTNYKEIVSYMIEVMEGEDGLDFPHELVQGWGNINKRYQANMPHTHGGVGLAAVLFLNNSKGLTLYYPSPCSGLNMSSITGLFNELEQYHVDVDEGDIVVFPSNLLHWVRPHNKDEHRVTFAVNIRIP